MTKRQRAGWLSGVKLLAGEVEGWLSQMPALEVGINSCWARTARLNGDVICLARMLAISGFAPQRQTL